MSSPETAVASRSGCRTKSLPHKRHPDIATHKRALHRFDKVMAVHHNDMSTSQIARRDRGLWKHELGVCCESEDISPGTVTRQGAGRSAGRLVLETRLGSKAIVAAQEAGLLHSSTGEKLKGGVKSAPSMATVTPLCSQ